MKPRPTDWLWIAAGNLYVAHLGTGHVLVYNPGGELVMTYDGGNYDVTNLAFGGPELNQLFITGASGISQPE